MARIQILIAKNKATGESVKFEGQKIGTGCQVAYNAYNEGLKVNVGEWVQVTKIDMPSGKTENLGSFLAVKAREKTRNTNDGKITFAI